jgi:tryptophan synthase alpha chain
VTSLEDALRRTRASGRTALVPYLMAGATPDWARHVEAAAHAGADAIEIGLPFSDPVMDGVVIQEAAQRSLAAGTTLDSVCAELATLDVDVPLVAMTYYNVVHHYGLDRAAQAFERAALRGAIIPDLPPEEASPWARTCADHDVATVYLVAPSSPPPRVALLARATQGFAYAAARMAVTGRAADLGDARRVVEALRDVSDVPVYVGIGITTPVQARDAARFADGVIVGSALVSLLLDGASTTRVEEFVGDFRHALDDVDDRRDDDRVPPEQVK